MTGRTNDDDAWRAIVDNYGERPQLDEPAPQPRPEAEAEPERSPGPPASLFRMPDLGGDDDREDDLDERFVPPEPPPLPHPPPVRMAAWTGLFGAPAVLLVCLMFGVALPSLLAYALVAAFLGGFAYLVLHMRRGPRDPWDDGAQV